MRFGRWHEAQARGYGGPTFKPDDYRDEYRRREYLNYQQMYDDVQLELDNTATWIKSQWGIKPQEIIWFQDSLPPDQYKSDLTVESVWKEDLDSGIRYLDDLHEYLTELDGEGVDEAEYRLIDQSTMKCIKELCWDFDWENLKDDDWDFDWGPYKWYPNEPGEWDRCRRIAFDNQPFPVTVLADGSMIDGAHRLAVALFQQQPYYPCLIGFPYHWFEGESGEDTTR